ncbi:MAG: hypothetical protein JNL96_28865 [Planctomycetaceae bacterium]|nr:hypothetical protein [Planctomycetaceae bacterium]
MPQQQSPAATQAPEVIHLPPLVSPRPIGPHLGHADAPTPFIAPRNEAKPLRPALPKPKADPKEIINGTVADFGRKLPGKVVDAAITLWAPLTLLGVTAAGIFIARIVAGRKHRERERSLRDNPIEIVGLSTHDVAMTPRRFDRTNV